MQSMHYLYGNGAPNRNDDGFDANDRLLPPPSVTPSTTDDESPPSPQSSSESSMCSMTGVEAEHCNNLDNTMMAELYALSRKMKMPIKQENGQRRFGPPEDCTSGPSKGCEVFVGKIPRDCYETELVPVFEKVGRIYEMRLMMDFSGTNRGYCFVQYFLPSHAQAACKELNHFEIRRGRYIGVVKSVDNCRLFIGGIPKNKSEQEIFREVSRITEGVVRVIVNPSALENTKNRGFAFIEYENHKAAAMARRKMIPGKTPMWGAAMCVDWAEPEPDIQVLYARNLTPRTTEATLVELFNAVSDNGVERVKKIKSYAFVHFISREKAEMAKRAMHGQVIDGSPIDVIWSKPMEKNLQKALERYNRGGAKIKPHFTHATNEGRALMDVNGKYGLSPILHNPALNQMDYISSQMQMMPTPNLVRNRSRAAAGVQGMRPPMQNNLVTSDIPIGNGNFCEMMPCLGPPPGFVQDQIFYTPYSAIFGPNVNAQTMY